MLDESIEYLMNKLAAFALSQPNSIVDFFLFTCMSHLCVLRVYLCGKRQIRLLCECICTHKSISRHQSIHRSTIHVHHAHTTHTHKRANIDTHTSATTFRQSFLFSVYDILISIAEIQSLHMHSARDRRHGGDIGTWCVKGERNT